MKTLQIDQKEALKLYPNASKEMKVIFENTFGKDFFNQKITDRINTLQDVYDILGITEREFLPYTNNINELNAQQKSINAQAILFKVAEAYNEGWFPNWKNSNEYKYLPYKYFSDGSWLVLAADYWYCACASASGLFFKSRELANDAIKKFSKIYDQYLMI